MVDDHEAADLTKGLCVKRGSAGEACPCADELACVSGVCVVALNRCTKVPAPVSPPSLPCSFASRRQN